ncbi:bifunctional UDP-N-acetylglucosamine diphosphorylase/glucosamine-1-phosphate N-acetyltransferase GlmU [Alphaproteobacteria bacterium HT1-32]|nr:bifunctional UDP-N-acetylglucosamine diphosphorylase/glucosamine-1-phosphate N-acetyltransferase GlmU [Alphaproteobacteria bacterium HT1-32]
MAATDIAVIVLAAGHGTRMKSRKPKVLHSIAGRPMLQHVIATAEALDPSDIVVVVGPDMWEVEVASEPHKTVEQSERLGTGHAALQAKRKLGGFDGDVLIMFGDSPLISPETLQDMIDLRRSEESPVVVVLGFRPEDPGPYGRLILDEDGGLERIVEAKDATPEELMTDLCNSGVMCVEGSVLFDMLGAIDKDNAQGEYYLTDIVRIAREAGGDCAVVEGDEEEMLGVNNRVHLAQAEAAVQYRMRIAAMEAGATLQDPDSVHFSWDTKLGRDVTVGPHVVFGPGVRVRHNAEIRAFSHLEGVTIDEWAQVGPFARLRPGARIGKAARVGNFVEVKNAVVEEGAKINHLSYIGDARVGEGANIGAGTITCNYDGYLKSHTDIGAGAFIGSNSALVAPVSIGAGAIIGAGSTITKDVEADAIAVERAPQKSLAGAALKFRDRKSAEKAAQIAARNKQEGF